MWNFEFWTVKIELSFVEPIFSLCYLLPTPMPWPAARQRRPPRVGSSGEPRSPQWARSYHFTGTLSSPERPLFSFPSFLLPRAEPTELQQLRLPAACAHHQPPSSNRHHSRLSRLTPHLRRASPSSAEPYHDRNRSRTAGNHGSSDQRSGRTSIPSLRPLPRWFEPAVSSAASSSSSQASSLTTTGHPLAGISLSSHLELLRRRWRPPDHLGLRFFLQTGRK